jgi:hypothetical protein
MLLGFIVFERGIEANPEKIAAITSMGPIKDLKGVQRVMGCLTALSRFISRLGERGLPLYRPLRKAECFTWTPEAEEALGNLKALLTNAPTLVPPLSEKLAKIASGRTTVPPGVFSRDPHQPSIKIDDTPEPEVPSAQSEAPLAWPEAPSARLEAPSVQPKVPSAPEGEALRVEEERSGVTPNRNWQTPYLQYLHRGKLPLDRAEARRLARHAKSFVLVGDEKELYHHSPSGILQRCTSIAEGQEPLREIHSGACGHHAAPRALVRNAFRHGFCWPTAVADVTRIVRTCEGCQFYARPTRLLAQALQTKPITWLFAVWGLDLVGPLQKAPGGYTHHWEGLFAIAKVLKPGTNKLADSQGEVYTDTWNIQQLRRFYP